MAYFPFFIEIEQKKCLVIGGGIVAYRKVQMLLNYSASITIVAPKLCDKLKRLEKEVIINQRKFYETDLEQVFLVIAATQDRKLNQKIGMLCRKKNILVNVADNKEECNFIFPALIRKGAISIGIITSGKSPVISHKLKEILENAIPDYYEILIEQLAIYRSIIKQKIDSPLIRKKILTELAEIGIQKNGNISKREVENLIEKRKKENI